MEKDKFSAGETVKGGSAERQEENSGFIGAGGQGELRARPVQMAKRRREMKKAGECGSLSSGASVGKQRCASGSQPCCPAAAILQCWQRGVTMKVPGVSP